MTAMPGLEGLMETVVVLPPLVTVIVACAVTLAVPTVGVAVSVYVVVAVGVTLTGVPLVTGMLPGVITPEPPLKTAVRLELDPDAMVAELAAKLVIDAGVTLVVVVCELEPPPPQAVKLRMATPAISDTARNAKLRFTMRPRGPDKSRLQIKRGQKPSRSSLVQHTLY